MWPSEMQLSQISRVSQITFNMHKVQPTIVRRRNIEITEWSLVATHDIAVGTFIGFYTGDFDDTYRDSLYAAKIDSMHIYPFKDESNISIDERKNRPLANMNEPSVGTYANCCFVPQDFKHDEIEGVQNIPGHKAARFFRGLACFTCENVKKNEELTWHYGNAYAPNRKEQGYEVGKPCLLLLEKQHFIEDDSRSVLSVLPKVPYTCLIPVTGLRKSPRFPLPKKKRRRNGSDDESEDESSSGSGHEMKYKPDANSRNARLERRNKKKSI